MRINRFEDVIAWQKAQQIAIRLYELFKDCRDFTFRDQLLRAAISITNNIAEGFDRGSDKELRQFLIIARGSTAEVRSMLLLAAENGIISGEEQKKLVSDTEEVSKLLTGFIKKLTSG